jgi:hypothetical protein
MSIAGEQLGALVRIGNEGADVAVTGAMEGAA